MRELFFLFLILFWIGLGAYPLAEPDEARNGEIAREMVVDGNWFPPTLNGRVRYQKPPLYYWVSAIFSKWFSSYEFGVRVVSALSATLLALLVLIWGEKMWGNGWPSALALVSFLMVFAYARIGRMDMLLSLFVAAAVFMFWEGRELPGGLFTALAFLTKGPVALVFVASAVVPMYLSGARFSPRRVLGAFLLFLVITASVFLLMEVRSPGYCRAFFWKENVLRYLTPVFKREEPFYYFILVLLVGLLPWTPWLIFGFRRRLEAAMGIRSDAFMLLGWMLIPVLFFSLSKSKLPHYILPSFPAWALFAGSTVSTPPMKILRGAALIYLVAVFVFFPWYASRRSLKELAFSVRSSYPFVPIYTLEEKLYGVSLYGGAIASKVDSGVLKGVSLRGRFWVVGKLKKLKGLSLEGCVGRLFVKRGKYAAVLFECSPFEKAEGEDKSPH